MLKISANSKQYRAFIKYAIKNCDSFSLIFEKDDYDKTKYVFQDVYSALAEFVVNRENAGYHPDTGTSFQNSDVIYCVCNKYTENVLQTANNFFDWDGESLPEEICFYRNNKKWFVCVSHEKCLFIYNETESDIVFLETIGIEYCCGI